MSRLSKGIMFFLAGCVVAGTSYATDFEVTQQNKQFKFKGQQAKALSVKVGDSVSFKNEDSFVHNIFSLSDTKTFDLGTYKQGEAKSVTFDKPGTVEIECAVHPDMKMVVEVKK